MTETYRVHQLECSRQTLDEVQQQRLIHIAQGKRRSVVRRDEELIEFWGNRVAFLSHVKADEP